MSKIKTSIIAAFAFTVLTGSVQGSLENGCFSIFFPSSAVEIEADEKNSEKIGGVTLVDDTDSDLKVGFKLAEIFKSIFGK